MWRPELQRRSFVSLRGSVKALEPVGSLENGSGRFFVSAAGNTGATLPPGVFRSRPPPTFLSEMPYTKVFLLFDTRVIASRIGPCVSYRNASEKNNEEPVESMSSA